MKFTIAALLIANSSAVLLQDDCDGKWCNKGLPYDHDVPTLNKAEADNVAKTQAFNGATKAKAAADEAAAAAAAAEAATKAADGTAGLRLGSWDIHWSVVSYNTPIDVVGNTQTCCEMGGRFDGAFDWCVKCH